MSFRAIRAKALRDQGYTLQSIGSKLGVSRERVRQILVKYYGTTDNAYLPRTQVSMLLGCSDDWLVSQEEKGLLQPVHHGFRYLYSPREVEKAHTLLRKRWKPPVSRVCEVCGRVFYRRPSQVRPTSPGRFCSKHCQGVWFSRNYGFGAHPENIKRGQGRKHDYEVVRKLREEIGWGARRIAHKTGIPVSSVTYILGRIQ